MASTPVELDGVCNFRSLGGVPTKDGKRIRQNALFRSEELSLLSPSDWAKLKGMNVRAICDLRRRDEYELYPTKVPDGMDVQLLWWDFDDAALQAMKAMTDKIRAALAPLATMSESELDAWVQSQYVKYHHGIYMCSGHIREVILHLAKDDFRPTIVHCGAGKDRTGFAIAMVLTALGVDKEAILDDYELTTAAYQKRVCCIPCSVIA